MNPTQLNGLLRHFATALGGAGIAASQDELQQFLSALLALIGIIWSLWEKRRGPAAAPPTPMLAWLLPTVFSGYLLTGCSSTATPTVVTPARVEAVVALGSYVGSQQLIRDGRRFEVERALAAVQTLQAADSRDMVAIAAALSAAKLTFMDTPEGVLTFGIVSSIFADRYGPEQILDSAYATAILAGAQRGISLALAPTRAWPGLPNAVGVQTKLRREAALTRSAH